MQIRKLIKNVNLGNLEFTDFSEKNGLTDKILNFQDLKILGKGAVGKTYLLENKYAVKKISPCEADEDSPLYKYCTDILKITNTEIEKIPGGFGKYRYLLPNLLSEILIGMILGKMKESVSFVPTLNSFIDESVYIIMKAEKSLINDDELNSELKITDDNPKTFIYFLFQIAHAIMTAQQKYRFTHYDLHVENVLWNNWEKGKNQISYPLPNNNRILIDKKDCPFILKISDFALGRLETEKTIISPSIDSFPIKSYGEFHPSYDIVSFLGAILIDNKYRRYFTPLFSNNLDVYRFMILFTLWTLNDKTKLLKNTTYEDLENIRDQIGNKYFTKIGTDENKFSFRPIREGDFIPYSKAKDLTQIVNFLGDLMAIKKYGRYTNKNEENVIYLKRLNEYKKYNDVSTYTPDIPLKEIPERKQSVGDFKEMIIDEFIKVRSYHFLSNIKPKEFNFTIEKEQIKTCPIQEHYLTAIFVKQGYQDKFKFGFDCCKLDPANYLLSTNKIGFTINGTFFAIKDDFLPIGKYSDNNSTINKYKIPEEYKDVFRYVILKNNRLIISKKMEEGEYFTTGPVLIENGKVVFDPNENRFECTDEKHAGKTMLTQDDDTITVSGYYKYNTVETENGFSCVKEYVPDVQTYPRCDKIKPGELSHSSNPNPRSLLCILKNGDYIFITVEGRARRGVGFDLYSLAQTILLSFPEIRTAVNLDGGRSSNMAWRSFLEPEKVYISNFDRNYVYPVGDILTLISI